MLIDFTGGDFLAENMNQKELKKFFDDYPFDVVTWADIENDALIEIVSKLNS